MKLNGLDSNKELFIWGPITYRVFYGAMFCDTLMLELPKYYPWPWPPFLSVFHNGQTSFILNNDTLRQVGKKYFTAYFLDKSMYRRQWRLWEQWMAVYWGVVPTLDCLDYRALTNEQLIDLYRSFYQFNIDFWLTVHVPEVANWGGEIILEERLRAINADHAHEYLEVLSTPTKPSFFQVEELELCSIAILKNVQQRERALLKHAKHYSWLLNSYGGNRVLGVSYFRGRLRALLKKNAAVERMTAIQEKINDILKRQEALSQQLKLSHEDRRIAEQLRQSIWWQDLRKSYIWRLHGYWDAMLGEIARRSHWIMNDLLNCWPKEVLTILEGGTIDRKKTRERRRNYVVSMNAKGYTHFYGARARSLANAFRRKSGKTQSEVHGLVVSKTSQLITRGRAIIVRDPFNDGKRMEKGDILVATMTSPEFVVVMRKAAAIVTDEGGMTAHAAVVSRELGIPCIVATRAATSVFKTGEMVEVDTNRGIVRKC